MKSFIQKHHQLLFYGTWLLLGLILSAYTELWDDEAYYWLYAKFFSWGYFDHPPMIAIAVKMGYAFFQNELGVRLVPLLMNVGTLLIIEMLLEKKNPWIFYAIAFSLGALQLAGFLAVPDTPLIFFTALFFYCYKKFINDAGWLNTLWLGIVAALLVYSKYHGVLILFFVLISNPKLFTRYQTYIAGLIAVLCFVPHLLWQYQHDWVSFRYHFTENNFDPYQLSFTTGYIIGQILLVGPIAGFILLPAAFLYKSNNKFEKALQFAMWGFYGFFLVSSFKGWVEANWTAPVLISFMVLSHNYLFEKPKWQKALYYTVPVSVVLFLLTRVFMIVDILPQKDIQLRYHSWKHWPELMKEKTQNNNVVFLSSYQLASKYWFYSGQTTYSMNDLNKRQNNFNFWPIEDSLIGKPAFVMDLHDLPAATDSMMTGIGMLKFQYYPSYFSFSRLELVCSPLAINLRPKDSLSFTVSVNIPSNYLNFLNKNPHINSPVIIGILKNSEWIKNIFPPVTLREIMAEKEKTFTVLHGLAPGKYEMHLGLQANEQLTSRNSRKILLTVE